MWGKRYGFRHRIDFGPKADAIKYLRSISGKTGDVQITSGSSRYFDLAWTPDGHLLYASDATGSADLWTMNGDGTGERQLTSGPGRNYSPASSPDAKNIVFHSNRDGNWNIWRVDANGGQSLGAYGGRRGGNWPR